jgi:WD40 repeat protein
MKDNVRVALCSVMSVTGAVIAGPVGGLLGSLAGGILAAASPGLQPFGEKVVAVVATKGLGTIRDAAVEKLTPVQRTHLNSELQDAFRDALNEALIDLGGSVIFQQPWQGVDRDVPDDLIFSKTPLYKALQQKKDPLTSQITACFISLQEAILSEFVFHPIDPNINTVEVYITSDTPLELNATFFKQLIAPSLSAHRSLLLEVPEVEQHLESHLLDRTLVHLEHFLSHRPEAWRAFNRVLLEQTQSQLTSLASSQVELIAHLDELTHSDLGKWSDQMAELISASGRIEKKLGDTYASLTAQLADQHSQTLHSLTGLLTVTARIESKVDRVLRMLEDGQWVVEGKPPVSTSEPPAPGQPPYMGMAYYDEDDASLFFGRSALTARLVRRISKERFLAVVGASGSGKSSVVRAGLIPAVRKGDPLPDGTLTPTDSQHWIICLMTPGSHPLDNLASSILPKSCSPTDVKELAAQFKDNPGTFPIAIHQAQSQKPGRASSHLLLIIDQFEELFTLCHNEDERQAFISTLFSDNNESTSEYSLIITLRADFYVACAKYLPLREELTHCQEYIGQMDIDELRQAIEEPARMGGWSFENGLVDLIVRDVGSEPGALPLLSHALLETWKHRHGTMMTLESYAESGGVRGAISHTADAIFTQRLTPEQQLIARRIFLRLTNLGEGAQDTRRRANLSELEPTPEVETVLHTLIDARLITVSEGSAEVAHEALIREWGTLRAWLEEDRENLRIQRRLTDSAAEWEDSNRDDGLLLRGSRLAEATEWSEHREIEMSTLEREFLTASREAIEREATEREAARQRELEQSRQLAETERKRAEEQSANAHRLRTRAFWLAGALIVAALFAVAAGLFASQSNRNANLASTQQARAEEQRKTAEAERNRAEQQAAMAQSGELAALAQTVADQFPQRAALLAIEAYRHNLQALGTNASPMVQTALWEAVTTMGGIPLPDIHGNVLSTVYDPSGQWFAVGTDNGDINVYSTSDITQPAYTLDYYGFPVSDLAFEPVHGWLVASGAPSLFFWDINNLLADPLGFDLENITDIEFSPDGHWMAVISIDNILSLWDIENLQKPIFTTSEFPGLVKGVSFSPDNSHMAIGHWSQPDGSSFLSQIQIYSLKDLEAQPLSLKVGQLMPISVTYSPDGRWLAVGGSDKVITLWSTDNLDGEPRLFNGHTGDIFDLAFSNDGNWLISASSDNTIRLWNLTLDQPEGIILRGHDSWVYTITLSPDNLTLISGGWDGSARYWNIAKIAVQPENLLIGNPVFNLALNSAGNQMVAVEYGKGYTYWDGDFVNPPKTYAIPNAEVWSSAFSPDSRWLALSTGNGDIYLTDASSPSTDYTLLKGHTGPVEGLAFSPDSRWLVTAGWDATLRVWDINQPTNSEVILTSTQTVSSVAFSPDGRWLAAGDLNFDIYILPWSAGKAGERLTVPRVHSGGINDLVFSPDSQTLYAGSQDQTVSIYNLQQLSSKPTLLTGHQDNITALAISVDGQTLATGSMDHTIRLWNTKMLSTNPIVLLGHTDSISGLAFTPDGGYLISASWDGHVRRWTLDLEKVAAQICQSIGRNLTADEWSQYLGTWEEAYHATCPEFPIPSD